MRSYFRFRRRALLRPTLLPVVTGLLLCAPISGAQDESSKNNSTESRLDRLERRFEESERRHQAELKLRDDEIARLKAQLRQGTAAGPTTAPSTRDTSTEDMLKEIQGATPNAEAAELERTRREVFRDAATRGPLSRSPVSFNPDFAVVTDYHASVSTDNDNPARNRFDVGSVELDLRAAVDPRADAVAIIPISRDVEDPLFFHGKRDANGSIDTSVDIEEAYLFLHDFGMPNLTAKLGRFHLRFGRMNLLHSHDWPTADNSFVNQSFLGSESLNDSGLSLSYVVPPKLIGGNYVEAIVELISGEGDESNPVLNNSALVDSPAVNVHLLWNRDIARDWNLEIGSSALFGKHNDDNRQNARLFGGDVTLIHTDPSGRFNNLLLQAEGIYGIVDTSRADTQHSCGAYLLAQQQVNRDWYLGCRLDWTQNALDEHEEVWGVSPYVSWYWSEFLRWRLEYQHKDGDVKREDTLYIQATWIFGAHPPHPYWAMR
jgi:hypothetical protein